MIDYHVNVPHNDCGVFGPRCQFCAVVGELAEPDFIAVFSENLLSVARELFPKVWEHAHIRQTSSFIMQIARNSILLLFILPYDWL